MNVARHSLSLVAFAAVLALAACATQDDTAAQSYVGQVATEATVAQAQAAAGATGAVRVIEPGQAVTMDFRGDRLNVEVDESNAIVRITCG